MLAGIYDPAISGDPARARARLDSAFADDRGAAHVIGPLAVFSSSMAHAERRSSAGCALDGSIYNSQELAAELDQTAPDALATIVEGYARWGRDLLQKIRGGFALVAWTHEAERVLLAQDHVGIGALFLHRRGDQLVFASEIRHLLGLLPRAPDPDEIAVARCLALMSLYDGRTMFAGVRRLQAGHMIELNGGRVEERRYWLPAWKPPFELSRLEVAVQFRDALVRSVGLRIRGQQRIGVTLSGGFDSSAVAAAAAAARGPGQDLLGYSAVFPGDPTMDDTDLLDALAGQLPLENVRFSIGTGGIMHVALAYVRDWKLPLSGPGWAIETPLMRQASDDGAQAMLDGQGGDEMFGPASYLVADRVRQGRVLAAVDLIRNGFTRRGGADIPWRPTLRLLKEYGVGAAVAPAIRDAVRRLRRRDDQDRFLTDRARALAAEGSGERQWRSHAGEAPLWWLYLRQLLVDDREAAGLGDFTRHRSRWFGIDNRPPLFDVELIEVALRIPPEYRFDRYLDRPIAREAVAGMLAEPVRISRRKSDLSPFYYRSMTGPDLPAIRSVLGGRRLEIERWVRGQDLRHLLDHPPPYRTGNWNEWLTTIWGCVSVESWLRCLSDPSFPEDMLAGTLVAEAKHCSRRMRA